MKDEPSATTAWTFRQIFSGLAGLCLLGAGVMDVHAVATTGSFDFTWKGGDSSTYAWPGDWFSILVFFLVEFGGGALCLMDFLRPARPRS